MCLVGFFFPPPSPDESFDLIVMNGLLEWVGKTSRFSDPREAQKASLNICRRLLKKGGYLYIGIENRFALAYMQGTDHSGLRFTSYMPRFLANLYCTARKGEPYNTHTYTKMGYEKLLRDCGFGHVDFYLAYPGYNLPRMMVPYDNLHALAYVVRTLMGAAGTKRSIARAMSRLPGAPRLYRYLSYSFGIVARK